MRRRRPKWLKNVAQLGPYIQGFFDDLDLDHKEAAREATGRQEAAAERFGISPRFLGSRLHDGWVTSLVAQRGRLQMSVSHEDFEWLGLGLRPPLGHRPMPVIFDFQRCNFVVAFKPAADGSLKPFSVERACRKCNTFLYADVPPWDAETLLWACVLWGSGIGHVLLVVESEVPSVTERHREAWLATYGEEFVWVHDAYAEVQDSVKLVEPNANEFLCSIGSGGDALPKVPGA